MLRPMIAKVCSSMRIASPVGLPSGTAEMSTAITNSAPICRAKRTGTGATKPPSTYSRVPMRTGWNTAGTALDEARLDEVCRPERYLERLAPVFERLAALS